MLPSDRRAAWFAGLTSQVIFRWINLPGHLLIRDLTGGALWTQLLLQGVAGALLLLVARRSPSLQRVEVTIRPIDSRQPRFHLRTDRLYE